MKKTILISAIVLLLVIVAFSSVYTVKENEYACTFRFSEIINTQTESGLHFKIPFIDSVKYFPKATQLYDIPPSAVITSDNPRTEVPGKIIEDILAGIDQEKNTCIVIENRREAIQQAMDIGKKHDIIVLAGKGHETYQEINGVKYPMDERQIVAEHLQKMRETHG